MMNKPVLQVCLMRRVLRVMAPPPPLPPQSPSLLLATRRSFMASNSNVSAEEMAAKKIMDRFSSSSSSYGDPCLDLFFRVAAPHWAVTDDDGGGSDETLSNLRQLLPVAWSHDPLTTLKLIFHFQDVKGKLYDEAFYTASFWLHHNHPRTLLSNLPCVAKPFGNLGALLEILCHFQQVQGSQDGVAERLRRDPEYKLLHDRVMDLFVEGLRSDIDKMKQNKVELKPVDYTSDDYEDESDDDDKDGTLDADAYADLQVTEAAMYLRPKSLRDVRENASILLCESVAKRLFPESEDHRAEEWERFEREVLLPLNKYWNRQGLFVSRKRNEIKKYLQDVKAAGGIIKPDALLPHQIIHYVEDGEVGEAAELQWNAMVQEIYQKQGNFKNCLALPIITNADMMRGGSLELAAGLELLVSETNEEAAWRGKVMTFSDSALAAQLVSIEGNDLKSRFGFIRSLESCSLNSVDFNCSMFYDLILEVGVNENLRAEQMINKVVVFTNHTGVCLCSWKDLYEAKKREFEKRGYTIPHIMFWNLWNSELPWIPSPHEDHIPGLTWLRGHNDNLIKCFLKNGGQITPRHLMEAAIASKEYQTLSLVD